jgi:hypothetical protein
MSRATTVTPALFLIKRARVPVDASSEISKDNSRRCADALTISMLDTPWFGRTLICDSFTSPIDRMM